MLTQSMRFMVN